MANEEVLEYLNWYDKIREEYSFYIYAVHALHLDYSLSLYDIHPVDYQAGWIDLGPIQPTVWVKAEMIDVINPHRPVDFKRLEKPHKRMLLFGKDLWLEEGIRLW